MDKEDVVCIYTYIHILQWNISHKRMKFLLLYSTWNYIQYPVLKHNGKEYVHICITESLCYTVEIITILYISYTLIK